MSGLGKNIVAEIGAGYALASTSVTAGGSGDATLITGTTINTASALTAPAIYPKDFNSVAFIIGGTATLAATKSITVTALIEDSADGSTWATLVASATVISVTSTGGGTVTFTGKIGADLTAARQYVRVKATPDLSATGTDTAVVFGVAVFGGAVEKPVA